MIITVGVVGGIATVLLVVLLAVVIGDGIVAKRAGDAAAGRPGPTAARRLGGAFRRARTDQLLAGYGTCDECGAPRELRAHESRREFAIDALCTRNPHHRSVRASSSR